MSRGWSTVTVTFRKIKRQARRVMRCQVCNKRLVRQHTFTMTVSPFNKNPDGSVCTPKQVAAKVQAEADAWRPPALCGEHWTT